MSAALTRSSWHVDADLSDNDLVAATRAGDSNAYGVLWDRHSPAALRAARAITSSIDPEDLVSEAFAKTFSAIKNGGGPTDAFRPYLFAAVRSAAATWGGRQKDIALEYIDELPVDGGEDSLDTLSDKALLATAFKDLPERWRTLLWYLEVEGMKPREIAPLMGLSPNAVSVLAARAREGFKTAWLQAHIAEPERDAECRWACERIVAQGRRRHVGRADRVRFEAHLEQCRRCTIASIEITEASSKLRAVLLPLIIGGPAAAAYSAGLPAPASASVGTPTHLARLLVAAGTVLVVGTGAVAFAGQILPGVPSESGASAPAPIIVDSPTAIADPSDGAAETPLPLIVPPSQQTRSEPVPNPESDDAEPSVPDDASGPIDSPSNETVAPRPTAPSEPTAPSNAPQQDRPAAPRATPVPPVVEPTVPPVVEPTVPPVVEPTVPPVEPTVPPVKPTAPPVVEPTDRPLTVSWELPQPATVAPDVTGTGAPGGEIQILDESGGVIGSTVVADDGTFTAPIDPSMLHQGLMITVRHTSPIAGTETVSDPLGPFVFEVPTVLGAGTERVVHRTDIDLDGASDDVHLDVHGISGASILMAVDGDQLPAAVLVDGMHVEDVLDLRPGLHRITLRYVDPASGDLGPEVVERVLVRP